MHPHPVLPRPPDQLAHQPPCQPPWPPCQNGTIDDDTNVSPIPSQRPPSFFSLNLHYKSQRPGPLRSKCKTNCRSIEIPLFIPQREIESTMATMTETEIIQAICGVEIVDVSRDVDDEQVEEKAEKPFPFLSLPLEIRLAIYGYLLPPRNHTIVTQYPHNGYYYSKPPSHTSQTLYPAWSASPHNPPSHNQSATSHILTTYKLLNANFRRDFPSPSICVEIFRTCKQILAEAEPVLYAGAMFDFGVYVDAVVPFLKDRSAVARGMARNLKMAREIPQAAGVSGMEDAGDGRQAVRGEEAAEQEMDPLWARTCEFLKDECGGLKTVDLTVWAESGDMVALPVEPPVSEADSDAPESEGVVLVDDGHLWREWEWTRRLLLVPGLRHVKVTWWGFAMDKVGQGRFDSWLGRRMVADKLVRDRMVWEGCVVEGVCVVPGGWQASELIGC